ncbi:Nuclear pore complex protein Nup98-Nup96 [Papilio machaon]|uniref:Nuclear pore complex protein Nup98-Nup96 n=1 Tax=Papilio machaon TaxID=76193 RepID=A0A0N1IPQ7_PAPMA|nr:Nuclear pore complex protein Nup98-Nup96 [Papilio machaon]
MAPHTGTATPEQIDVLLNFLDEHRDLARGRLRGADGNVQAKSLGGSAAGGGVHEQILTLAARTYGDSPLFKDLLPDSGASAEEALKPTNPAALKAALDTAYKVASPTSGRLRVIPTPSIPHDKNVYVSKDPSLEDKLSLKPSRKRLVLRPSAVRNDARDAESTVDSVNRLTTKPLRKPLASNSEAAENSVRELAVRPQRSLDKENVDSSSVSEEENIIEQEAPPHPAGIKLQRPGYYTIPSLEDLKEESDPSLEDKLSLKPSRKRLVLRPSAVRNDARDAESTVDSVNRLTTKPLRKPLASNSEAAENSVRELAVRPQRSLDKENVDSSSECSPGELFIFCCHRWGQEPGCSRCETLAKQIAGLYVSEEENVIEQEAPPHPAGIKLQRPGYYTIPSLEDLKDYIRPDGSCVVPNFTIGRKNYGKVFYDCEMDVANLDLDTLDYIRPDGSCVVPNFTIGRKNYGKVFYDCEMDVANLDLDTLVHFLNKEVIIYSEDADKPPIGQALNRKAVVTLDRVWPRDKTQRRLIVDPDR